MAYEVGAVQRPTPRSATGPVGPHSCPTSRTSMYLPDAFRLDDRATLFAQAEAYPFATVITHGEGGLAVSHLPLLVDAGRDFLRGLLARVNTKLAHLSSVAEWLAIF